MSKTKVLVMCEDWKSMTDMFYELREYLDNHKIRYNIIDFAIHGIGTKYLYIQFFDGRYFKESMISGMLVEYMYGFPVKMQKDHLKEGYKPTKKMITIDDIKKMFKNGGK